MKAKGIIIIGIFLVLFSFCIFNTNIYTYGDNELTFTTISMFDRVGVLMYGLQGITSTQFLVIDREQILKQKIASHQMDILKTIK